ncbi:hypothetical protein CDL15_Pgr001129 [Punica granatum]|uniref:Uncharacterized protein n=1 Tax=Punica granatum TaxID=22663 RepID=A0A218WJN7_PUNGR|nr:hypothetical protein CDL15_Pgr001129 [Punica granatum]
MIVVFKDQASMRVLLLTAGLRPVRPSKSLEEDIVLVARLFQCSQLICLTLLLKISIFARLVSLEWRNL